jgi:hypothetical protein
MNCARRKTRAAISREKSATEAFAVLEWRKEFQSIQIERSSIFDLSQPKLTI